MKESFEKTGPEQAPGGENQHAKGVIPRKRCNDTGAKNLAEAIILQSIEDLWSPEFKKDSIEFFRGEGFNICAQIAGMSTIDQLRVMHMVRSSAQIPEGLI